MVLFVSKFIPDENIVLPIPIHCVPFEEYAKLLVVPSPVANHLFILPDA